MRRFSYFLLPKKRSDVGFRLRGHSYELYIYLPRNLHIQVCIKKIMCLSITKYIIQLPYKYLKYTSVISIMLHANLHNCKL